MSDTNEGTSMIEDFAPQPYPLACISQERDATWIVIGWSRNDGQLAPVVVETSQYRHSTKPSVPHVLTDPQRYFIPEAAVSVSGSVDADLSTNSNRLGVYIETPADPLRVDVVSQLSVDVMP